jgi:hypothetical protein
VDRAEETADIEMEQWSENTAMFCLDCQEEIGWDFESEAIAIIEKSKSGR